jgi:type II secretory pathway pseudopilin PulG
MSRVRISKRLPGGLTAGFTLVELAIVLFIITLLLGGMLTPLSQQIAERQQRETRQTLEDARLAVTGYALAHRDALGHPYLPCPDLRDGHDAGDGEEDRLPDGHCAATVGNLPWRSLGVAATDAWGNRLSYAVTPSYADANHGITTTVGAGGLTICPEPTCTHALEAAAVLLSHGHNGWGARNATGHRNLAPSSADERENAGDTLRFIDHPPSASDRPGGEFDDLVTWLSPSWLLGRLCDPASDCAGR